MEYLKMISEQDVREKFEAWASKQHHNLTRHPTNSDFYYNRDVSMLWVCFYEGYSIGRLDENANVTDILKKAFDEEETSDLPEVAQIMSERNESFDE